MGSASQAWTVIVNFLLILLNIVTKRVSCCHDFQREGQRNLLRFL